MLRFETAGESHGECLVATLTGLPSGVPISLERVNRELWRRQQGFGRGGRMKIETDTAHVVSGVRHSKTIGAPIAMIIQNRDWKNWTDSLPVEDFDGSEDKKKKVLRPRPGHAGCFDHRRERRHRALDRRPRQETRSFCRQRIAGACDR